MKKLTKILLDLTLNPEQLDSRPKKDIMEAFKYVLQEFRASYDSDFKSPWDFPCEPVNCPILNRYLNMYSYVRSRFGKDRAEKIWNTLKTEII